MRSLALAFMGTPEFAVPTLAALVAAGHDVRCVYTQPPRPAGRGKRDRPSPVQQWAEANGLEVVHPTGLKDVGEQDAFAALALDAAVVVAYGLILPTPILEAPRLGCINLHASLLPRWRGAAPIQRAIMAGDGETGLTTMLVDEGLDTGDMLLVERVAIGLETTAGELHDILAAAGGPLMVRTLAGLDAGEVRPIPQPEAGVTYARKIDKAEARLDWTRPARELAAQVQGLSPFPGAWFEHAGERIKLLRADAVTGTGVAGTVIDAARTIACGEGALRPRTLQRAGKGPLDAADFLRGLPLTPGTRLD